MYKKSPQDQKIQEPVLQRMIFKKMESKIYPEAQEECIFFFFFIYKREKKERDIGNLLI